MRPKSQVLNPYLKKGFHPYNPFLGILALVGHWIIRLPQNLWRRIVEIFIFEV